MMGGSKPYKYKDKSFLETLFVYGTLKRGFRLHAALQRGRFIGTGFTVDDSLILYRTRTTTAFPVMLRAIDDDPRAAVSGEVYRVTSEVLLEIDKIEGGLYKRVLSPVRFQLPEGKAFKTLSWLYRGDRTFWNSHIEDHSLTTCPIYVSNKEKEFKYYLFQKNHQIVTRSGRLS